MIDGPTTSIMIDSGSDILLVSSKLLEQLKPAPKPHEGQHIKINQVTGHSATTQYIMLELFFETDQQTVSMGIEAYIVKDMNRPLILGNNFADQYLLSMIWDNGNTSLKLGDSRCTIPLDSLVESSYLNVQALQACTQAIQHQKNNCCQK